MKNEVNRALVAKKNNYINPSVQVAQFASMGLMQAASPAGPGNTMGVHSDIPGEQW